MELSDHTLELLAIGRAQPFSYDHDAKEFHFGNEKIPPSEMQFFGSAHTGGENLTANNVRKMVESTPFVHNYVHPIGLPLASEFFEEGWTDEIASETKEIMADVFMEYTKQFKASEREQLLSIRSFDTVCRKGSGDVILSTLGSCACLGPDYTSHYVLDDGAKEYTYHNIDLPSQRLSLLAGLGHIARRANEWR